MNKSNVEVLYLEDDVPDQRAFKKMVRERELRWGITIAQSLADARKQLKLHSFDVIIADYHLPDGPSTDLFGEVSGTPFVLVTSTLREQLALRTLERGADDYLIKDQERTYLAALPLAVEKTLHRQQIRDKARRVSEELTLLIEGVKDYAIYMLDPEGRVTSWNQGAERIFGYKSDIVGEHFSTFFTDEERAAGVPQKELNIAKASGAYNADGWRLRRNGTKFWASVTLTALRNDDGTVRGFVKVARDITERKQTEEELRAAMVSAEQANQAKDQFLSVLSHELRTPLTPVLAAVTLMERDNPSRQAQLSLDVIRRNVMLQARLIDDLLDLTRIVRGNLSLDKKALDLCVVLERSIETCKTEIEARNLDVQVSARGCPHTIWGDMSRLQQVVWNLLSNAIKFTPDGGCIGVHCCRENDAVALEVADSGVGIEPELLPQIFGAFEQGDKDTRQFGGLGLGLAITKRLVEMHDGTISAHSDGKGQGATFRVLLPVFEQQVKAEDAAGGPRATSLRILLVEDHGDTLRLFHDLLKSTGYQVESAGDVATALAAAQRRDFDVLVSDLGLPDRSGLELARELREIRKPLRAIAMSGFGQEEDLRKSKEAGFIEHLTKPVDFDALISAIERVARA